MAVLKSQGAVFKIGDGATPTEAFNAIGEVISVSGIGSGSAAEIDVTTLASSGKEFIMGIPDGGEVSIEFNLDPSDTQQTALRTARANQAKTNFRLELTDAGPTVINFSAFVKSFEVSLAVDDRITGSVSLRLTGLESYA